ncbi:hypothetical protein EVAR_24845_1 [Eumeta japonica]|uniref:Uncharacterized protein n=1 Tax=Eumeta variegata TaxID=151549 RepID=A0A4C1YCS5_EUMVA|nr:hypothetical protein EVAR_24845_1 [Eumeta japonica]
MQSTPMRRAPPAGLEVGQAGPRPARSYNVQRRVRKVDGLTAQPPLSREKQGRAVANLAAKQKRANPTVRPRATPPRTHVRSPTATRARLTTGPGLSPVLGEEDCRRLRLRSAVISITGERRLMPVSVFTRRFEFNTRCDVVCVVRRRAVESSASMNGSLPPDGRGLGDSDGKRRAT